MKSTLSDPVAAGINAFGAVSNILNQNEAAGQRKKLFDLQMEEGSQKKDLNQIQLDEARTQADLLSQLRGSIDKIEVPDDKLPGMLTNVGSAIDKSKTPDAAFTEDEGNALRLAVKYNPILKPAAGKSSDITKKADAISKILDFNKHALGQIQPGTKARFDEDKYPTLLESLNEVYGPMVNKGSDKNGLSVEEHGVQKKIKSVFLDTTSNPPTFSFLLNVRTPTDQVYQPAVAKDKAAAQDQISYDAPMTLRHSGDQDDAIATVPLPLAGAQLTKTQELVNAYESYMKKAKPIEYGKETKAKVLNRQQNDAIFQALDEVKSDKTLTTSADRREAVVRKIVSKNPDSNAKDVAATVKEIIPDKAFTSVMGSQVGKRMEDRARLVASSSLGEKDPAVIAFDKESAGAEKKKGSQKTIYGPGGKTKEVWIEDGKDYEPPAGYSLAKPEKPEKDTTEKDADKKQKRVDDRLKSGAAVIKRNLPSIKAGEETVPEKRLVAGPDEFGGDEAKAKAETEGRQRAYKAWTNEYIRKNDMDPEQASAEAIKQIDARVKGGGNFLAPTAGKKVAERPGSKTVKIDGKDYKDGDIIEKNGKKFRVKVK